MQEVSVEPIFKECVESHSNTEHTQPFKKRHAKAVDAYKHQKERVTKITYKYFCQMWTSYKLRHNHGLRATPLPNSCATKTVEKKLLLA
jgi:hypothetical protein